jgi:DNA-binding response OmpR family regulator
MCVSELVADLERELEAARAEIAALKAQLLAQDLEPVDAPAWGVHLPPARAAIMDTLRSRPEQVFSRRNLRRALPFHSHGQMPSEDVVDVHVCAIRKALGFTAIETVGGRGTGMPFLGYRLGLKYRDTEGGDIR